MVLIDAVLPEWPFFAKSGQRPDEPEARGPVVILEVSGRQYPLGKIRRIPEYPTRQPDFALHEQQCRVRSEVLD
jgi:hypothetical protein